MDADAGGAILALVAQSEENIRLATVPEEKKQQTGLSHQSVKYCSLLFLLELITSLLSKTSISLRTLFSSF